MHSFSSSMMSVSLDYLLYEIDTIGHEKQFLDKLNYIFSRYYLPNDQTLLLNIIEALLYKGWIKAARRFYDAGVTIPIEFLRRLPIQLPETPLMQACRYDLIPVIAELVKGANLFEKNEAGLNVLMQVQSVRAAELICEEVTLQNDLQNFLLQKSADNKTACDFAKENNQEDVVNFYKKLDFDLLNELIHEQEEETIIIEKLENIVSTYNTYPKIISFVHKTEEDDSSWTPPLSGSLLGWAIWFDYLNLAKVLIEKYKADLEAPLFYNNELLNGQTPLALACENNNIPAVLLLLSYKPNLVCTTDYGHNLFYVTDSAQVITLIGEAASKEELHVLLSSKVDEACPLLFHVDNKNFQAVNSLYNLMNPQGYLSWQELWTILSKARHYSWIYSEERSAFDELCNHLRPLLNIPNSKYPPYKYNPIQNNRPLFKKSNPVIQTIAEAKQNTLKKVIEHVNFLFKKPERCISYFQFLNSELLRYYKTTYNNDFPSISANYSFQRINGLFYPIPNPNFDGVKMNNVLYSVLQTIFKKYGLGEVVVKWIGFIPIEIANDFVKNGGFAVESGIGATLFHGKVVHMLQLLIIIYAWEDKTIPNTFTFEGIEYSLTLRDIVESYISLNDELNPEVGSSLWQATRDTRALFFQISDPSALNSFVMYKGHQYGFNAVADYLVNSFCKSFLKYHEAYKLLFPAITIDMFCNHMKDLKLHEVLTPPDLLENDIQTSIFKKNPSQFFSRGENYAIVEKRILINPNFSPLPSK